MLSSRLNSFAWLGSLPVPSKLNTSVFIAVLSRDPRGRGPVHRSRRRCRSHPHQSSCVVSAARSGARAETTTSALFARPE